MGQKANRISVQKLPALRRFARLHPVSSTPCEFFVPLAVGYTNRLDEPVLSVHLFEIKQEI
jgi:hypothetical protein